jgi:hypothetical protein
MVLGDARLVFRKAPVLGLIFRAHERTPMAAGRMPSIKKVAPAKRTANQREKCVRRVVV